MSPLLILATAWMVGWEVVVAADVTKGEMYSRYENGSEVFTRDIVFQRPALTPIHCAILCQRQDGCEAFTFEGEACSGHRIAWTSSSTGQSANRPPLFVKEGPCSSNTVLDEAGRDVSNPHGELCDKFLPAGWYRFLPNGSDAVIPTYCVPRYQCDTRVTFWLDLEGGQLPTVGQETDSRACGSWIYKNKTRDCCWAQTSVTVRSCGAFLVYRLEPTHTCPLAYCTTTIYT